MNKEAQNIIDNLKIEDEVTTQVIEALTKYVSEHYPDGLIGSVFEPNAATHAMIPMSGANPIAAVLAYKGKDHHCYVTYFLAPKIGYELSFRIASDTQKFEQGFVNLLSNLANAHLMGTSNFLQDEIVFYDTDDWFRSDIKGLLITKDPVLGAVTLDIGEVKYLQAVGLTSDEAALVKTDDEFDMKKAKSFLEERLKTDPALITKETS